MNQKPLKSDILFSVALFIFAFAVRVWIANSIMGDGYPFVMGDDDDYHRIAVNFLENRVLFDGTSYAYRLPVFPLLLSAIYSIKRDPNFASLVLIGLSAVIPVGTFWLGKRWFGLAAGLIAGILVAVDLNLIFYAPLLLTETLAVALVMGFFLVLEKFIDRPGPVPALFLGVLLGMMVLTRVNLGIFLVAAVLAMLVNRRLAPGIHLRKILISAVVAVLIWSLWVIRNAVVLSAIVPFTTQSGNAYFGVYNHDAARCEQFQECGYWINLDLPENVAALEEVERDRIQRNIAADWIKDHPLSAMKIALLQPIHFWRPTWFMDILIYLLAGLSLVISPIKLRKPGIFVFMLSILLASLFSTISIGVERFHLPFLPGLYLLAAFSSITVWEKSRVKRSHKHPDSLA